MGERTTAGLLVAAISIVGASSLYAVHGEHLRFVPNSRHPVAAAESYWWNKFRHEGNVGKHACRADTGEYTGPILRAFYGEWAPPSGRRDRRWLYVVRVDLPPDIPLAKRVNLSSGRTMGPAIGWTATTGKCPDGRP